MFMVNIHKRTTHDEMITDQDLKYIALCGMANNEIEDQIHRFRDGFPYISLDRPCIPDNGILRLSRADHRFLLELYEEAALKGRVSKFIPASGAGSRMFQGLFGLKNTYAHLSRIDLQNKADEGDEVAQYGVSFFNALVQYPFYGTLIESLGEKTLNNIMENGPYEVILDELLTKKGFNYPDLPKGLLPFHRYKDQYRTPFEEHLVEADAITKTSTGQIKIHFTVSPEHMDRIKNHVDSAIQNYNPDTTFEISFSTQNPSTDTIAVDLNNQPFRGDDGQLLFRAGGHGALLENLGGVHGDIIFIKNIDNVVPDHKKVDIHYYKRLLGGFLIQTQNLLFNYAEKLGQTKGEILDEVLNFCRTRLSIEPPKSALRTKATTHQYLKHILERPVRVCGMVRHTGEPGGGPFFVKNKKGEITPQIVESAQVNMDDRKQKKIFESSTHFNPVDLVCGIRNRHGTPFDLSKYRDPETGFISYKSKGGQPLKAMEHPGLWNGSMAHWNTQFVEVPAHTFNPVKTIEDLVRPSHQPQ